MKTYYHVTFIESMNKILEKGIKPQRRQLWSSARDKSLGKKDVVYAFSNFSEAVIWAARMEWHFKRPLQQVWIVPFTESPKLMIKDMNLQMQLDYPSAVFKYGRVTLDSIGEPIQVTRDMIKAVVQQKQHTP